MEAGGRCARAGAQPRRGGGRGGEGARSPEPQPSPPLPPPSQWNGESPPVPPPQGRPANAAATSGLWGAQGKGLTRTPAEAGGGGVLGACSPTEAAGGRGAGGAGAGRPGAGTPARGRGRDAGRCPRCWCGRDLGDGSPGREAGKGDF